MNHFNLQMAVIYISVYIFALYIALIDKLDFSLRLKAGLAIFYVLGITNLVVFGTLEIGRIYLICFCAFATLFLSLRGALFSLTATVVTLIATGLMFQYGILIPDRIKPVFDPKQWFVFTTAFATLGGAVTIGLSLLIHALAVTGRRYQHLLRDSSDIIWSMDQDWNITFINSPVSDIFGYHSRDWIGWPLSRFMNDTDTKRLEQYLSANNAFCMEAVIRHHDQRPVPVEIIGHRRRQFPDTPLLYQGTIKNISRIKQLKEKQVQLEEQLHQADHLKNLGQITGAVAHDLNNILSGLASYPEVLLMATDLEPDIEKGLKIIRDSGQQASAAVSDLLAIAKAPRAEKEMININSLIRRYTQSHDYAKIKNRHSDVTIELQLTQELPDVRGAYLLIEKSLMNLLLNAVEEAAGRIDGHVQISTANHFIDGFSPGSDHRKPGDYVILSVTDNGPGLSREDQEKLFTPFHTNKEMGKSGTGLGMPLIWSTVRDHKGYLDVTSSDKGTRFDLIFPADRQAIVHSTSHTTPDKGIAVN